MCKCAKLLDSLISAKNIQSIQSQLCDYWLQLKLQFKQKGSASSFLLVIYIFHNFSSLFLSLNYIWIK